MKAILSCTQSASRVTLTDVMEGWGTRLLQPWLSASCPPAAAPLSSAGLSTLAAWLAPPALRRSVPLNSLAYTARGNPRHLMTAITTRRQMLTCPMMTKSTARRRTSSRKRRREVRTDYAEQLWVTVMIRYFDHLLLFYGTFICPV